MAEILYDGSVRLRGVWGDQHPLDVARGSYASDAINRTFRHGVLGRTRPRFIEPTLVFPSAAEEDWFRKAAFQGGIPYLKTTKYRSPGCVVAVGGRVYFGRLAGQTIFLREIYRGLSPDAMHVWFVQAEERVYAQDNINRPMAWSGHENDEPYAIEESETEQRMPIGNIMAFAHGRILVANEDGQIAVSDHMNSSADRLGVERFTENTAFFGGTFSMPSVLGQLVSMQVQPAQESRNYHGAVVVLCENGAASIDISGPRFSVDADGQPTGIGLWQDAKVLYVGPGFVSHAGSVAVNNDIWSRRVDGIQTLQSAYQRESRGWTDPVLSRPISHHLQFDSDHLMQFIPMGYFDNRVFCGVAIETQESSVSGLHRFCRGMVVADVLGTSDAEGQLQWEGLWTGPQPMAFLSVNDPSIRTLIMSFNGGENRIYEFSRSFGDDPSGPVKSRVVGPAYEFASEKGGGRFVPKELLGGGRTRIVMRGNGAYESSYRPDDEASWHALTTKEVSVDDCGDICLASASVRRSLTFAQAGPDPAECGDEQRPASRGHYFQLRHDMTGDVEMIFCRVRARADNDQEVIDCEDRDFALDAKECELATDLDYTFT